MSIKAPVANFLLDFCNADVRFITGLFERDGYIDSVAGNYRYHCDIDKKYGDGFLIYLEYVYIGSQGIFVHV